MYLNYTNKFYNKISIYTRLFSQKLNNLYEYKLYNLICFFIAYTIDTVHAHFNVFISDLYFSST